MFGVNWRTPGVMFDMLMLGVERIWDRRTAVEVSTSERVCTSDGEHRLSDSTATLLKSCVRAREGCARDIGGGFSGSEAKGSTSRSNLISNIP
jgi:hypothetical protein